MWSNAWFLVRSRNTLGYGIHSPHLFYIARMILPERAQYYCFEDLRNYGITKLQHYGTAERKKNETLFRLVNFMKAETIVEVGAKDDVRTKYLQAPNSKARVLTPEAVQVSGFKFQVPGTVDFAVMSATEGERCFERLAKLADEKSLFVVDDIRENKANWQVWKAIEASENVSARMDLGQMGLVFFDPHFPKQTFRIRV